jgi:hypothetical protein
MVMIRILLFGCLLFVLSTCAHDAHNHCCAVCCGTHSPHPGHGSAPIVPPSGPPPLQCNGTCSLSGWDTLSKPGSCPATCDPAVLDDVERLARANTVLLTACASGCGCLLTGDSRPVDRGCSEVRDMMDEDGRPLEKPVIRCGYWAQVWPEGVCRL